MFAFFGGHHGGGQLRQGGAKGYNGEADDQIAYAHGVSSGGRSPDQNSRANYQQYKTRYHPKNGKPQSHIVAGDFLFCIRGQGVVFVF